MSKSIIDKMKVRGESGCGSEAEEVSSSCIDLFVADALQKTYFLSHTVTCDGQLSVLCVVFL